LFDAESDDFDLVAEDGFLATVGEHHGVKQADKVRAETEASASDADLAGAVELAVAQWRHERPDLDPSSMMIFGRIARIFTLQRSAQAKVHGPFGLSHAAFDMLANLRRSGWPHRKTATSLARSSLISTGGATFRMDGLEDDELIRRVRDDTDRRVVYAELTGDGIAVIDRAIERHLELFDSMLGDLSPKERDELAHLLAKLEASIARHSDR
jgi:DNA-binding MarR family transcriptional regulator